MVSVFKFLILKLHTDDIAATLGSTSGVGAGVSQSAPASCVVGIDKYYRNGQCYEAFITIVHYYY